MLWLTLMRRIFCQSTSQGGDVFNESTIQSPIRVITNGYFGINYRGRPFFIG